MSYSSVIKQEKFWKVLKYLANLESRRNWDEVCFELSLTSQQLNSFLVLLKEVSLDFKIDSNNEENETFLIPPESNPKIEMNFTLIEWLEFQANFPFLDEAGGEPFHDDFQIKLEEFESEHKSFDLFSPLDVFEHSQKKSLEICDEQTIEQQEVLSQVEKSIVSESVIELRFKHAVEREIIVFPRKVVFIDGALNLVYENTHDNTLMQATLRSINNVICSVDVLWQPVFTQNEIEEFVNSMREMSECSTRLVLKIKSYEKFQLNLEHHFFGNPCVFTNGVGEIIWAATIEPNEKIFDWLASLGQDVEILESIDFKREYLIYCESKLKKLA